MKTKEHFCIVGSCYLMPGLSPHPFTVLLLHVQVVGGVETLLHSSSVSGDSALNGPVPWSRSKGKLLQVFNRQWGSLAEELVMVMQSNIQYI